MLNPNIEILNKFEFPNNVSYGQRITTSTHRGPSGRNQSKGSYRVMQSLTAVEGRSKVRASGIRLPAVTDFAAPFIFWGSGSLEKSMA